MAAPRILLIDDSPTIRKLVELTFLAAGWEVSLTGSGRDGVASAGATPPDLIVLDYVLPDMRGIDVCAQLASEPKTRGIPIVVVTAKSDEVRAQFEPFAAVMACLPKPFTPEQLKKVANAAIAGRDREALHFSQAQRDSAAQLLFGKLRSAFANVPQWTLELGASSPAAFFARKVLTKERVEGVLEALLPLYREILASRPVLADVAGPCVRGDLQAWPLGELLDFFGTSRRSGELSLTVSGRKLLAYWCDGEIVMVTSTDPDDYVNGIALGRQEPAALARAKAEQRVSGKPVFVTLAEDGALLPASLGDLLHRQGRRLLLEAIDARLVTFVWRELAALPLYVEAHGRRVSTARNTLILGIAAGHAPAPTSSLEQLALEQLRREPTSAKLDDDTVLDRLRGFSDRIRRFDLDADERRVLAVTDGVHTVSEVASRASLSLDAAARVLTRLAEVGLIGIVSHPAKDAPRPVLILEPDVEGFQRPLEALLRDRAADTPLLSLDGERDIVGAIRRERPRLVILNAAMTGQAMERTARAVRTQTELADVSLVAVLETEGAPQAAALRAAGFDAVFVKPVACAELERLIDC